METQSLNSFQKKVARWRNRDVIQKARSINSTRSQVSSCYLNASTGITLSYQCCQSLQEATVLTPLSGVTCRQSVCLFCCTIHTKQTAAIIGFSSSARSSPSDRIMDPLASSHTAAGTRTGRRLLIMFFALVLFRHSIVTVADASDYENLQDVSGVSQDSDLGRLRIRAEQDGPNDVLDRIGSEGTAQAEVRPPALGMRGVEGWTRKILGDISPPGMWPTPDGQDDATPVVNDEFRRRSLLTGTTSPPPLAPFFMVMHSSQDGEDAFLRQALVADKTYPVVHWGSIVNKLKQLGSVINRSSVGFRIRLAGSLRVNAVAAEDSLEQIEQVVVPDADRTSPDPTESEIPSSIEHFEESISSQQKLRVQEPKFRSRSLLQGDISPPGMWDDSDDDESQLSESVLLRRRRLLSM